MQENSFKNSFKTYSYLKYKCFTIWKPILARIFATLILMPILTIIQCFIIYCPLPLLFFSFLFNWSPLLKINVTYLNLFYFRNCSSWFFFCDWRGNLTSDWLRHCKQRKERAQRYKKCCSLYMYYLYISIIYLISNGEESTYVIYIWW